MIGQRMGKIVSVLLAAGIAAGLSACAQPDAGDGQAVQPSQGGQPASAESGQPADAESGQGEAEPAEVSEESGQGGQTAEEERQGELGYLLVQRSGMESGVNLRYGLRNSPENGHALGLLERVDGLLWMLYNGGHGIDPAGTAVRAEDFPAVQDTDRTARSNEILWVDEENLSASTWVRLVFQVPQTSEDHSLPEHRDILLYVDPELPADAVLALQQVDDNAEWETFRLAGYGQWLAREIDILTRLRMGV